MTKWTVIVPFSSFLVTAAFLSVSGKLKKKHFKKHYTVYYNLQESTCNGTKHLIGVLLSTCSVNNK